MSKNLWFWLNRDTFIWKNKNKALIYNSERGNGFLIPLSTVSSSLAERIIDPKQMYCTDVTQAEMNDSLTKELVNIVVLTNSGGVCQKVEGMPKPIVMFPKLNIQRSVERQSKIAENYRDDKIMLDLFEISICFNGISDKSKTGWHKQFLYPPVTEKTLKSDTILKHLKSLSGSTGLSSINLLGSDFSTVESFTEITDLLYRINATKTVWCRLENLTGKMAEVIKTLQEGYFELMIMVDPVNDKENSEDMINALHGEFPNAGWKFIITGELEYEKVVNISKNIANLEELSIVPLFNGENHKFFREHVFIIPENLLNSGLTKREVFAHQVVNTFNFGKISLMPDGMFYANQNHPPVGNGNENLKEVLHRELFTGRSWRMIRDREPCTDCLYRWLCPSPSNYELVIGQPDLCIFNP